MRLVVNRHAPELTETELITLTPGMSLLALGRFAAIPAKTLTALAADLSAASEPI